MSATGVPLMAMTQRMRCAIYCHVIDNFGDIGVCWRLARELVSRNGWQVRLIVDDLEPWAKLAGVACSSVKQKSVSGVHIEPWPGGLDCESQEVVIEAFACELPFEVIDAMERQAVPPVWINLEYFATEDWASGCHGLPSLHPPLTKYFFFPGVVPGTGGLIRESEYDAQRREHLSKLGGQTQMYLDASTEIPLRVFVFSYPTAPVSMLLEAMRRTPVHVRLMMPPGAAHDMALHSIASRSFANVTIESLPFVQQAQFDAWLWEADLSFVRGEDSCARAQLSGRPWIWQPYRQDAGVHHVKRNALEAHYKRAMPPHAAQAWQGLQDAWNAEVPNQSDISDAWQGWLEHHSGIRAHAERWAQGLRTESDLVTRMTDFVHMIRKRENTTREHESTGTR
jgi:uncharacterized repeat protein (TIGR03837 family)